MTAGHRRHRAAGLPPGQRATARFPRFSDKPLRPAPPTEPVALRVSALGRDDLVVDEAVLAALGMIEARSDFHCVTTWSHLGVAWGGVPMRAVWDELIAPWAGTQADAGFTIAVGADEHRAVLVRDDLLAPDVLLALSLDGEPLDARHGAPLRLVSPHQYGYKSVKHRVGLAPRDRAPSRVQGTPPRPRRLRGTPPAVERPPAPMAIPGPDPGHRLSR